MKKVMCIILLLCIVCCLYGCSSTVEPNGDIDYNIKNAPY